MWLLQWLPDWIFYLLLLAGIVGIAISKFVPGYYRSAVQIASAIALMAGLFMSGAIHEKAAWELRVKEMELKMAEVKSQSAEANTKIVEKTITQRQIIKQRGDDIVRYIDREVVKYDQQCVIPKEFIEAHNKSAEPPVK